MHVIIYLRLEATKMAEQITAKPISPCITIELRGYAYVQKLAASKRE